MGNLMKDSRVLAVVVRVQGLVTSLGLALCLLASPAHAQCVKGIRNEVFSLPSSSFQPIPFEANEEHLNDTSLHDPQTSRTRFTAPVDGAYLLFATAVFEKQAGGYIRNLCIIKNADVVKGVLACNSLTSPNDCFAYEGCAVSVAPTLTYLFANDFVEYWAYQDTGKPVEIRYGTVGYSSFGVMIRE
jgi:hypothetical protein